MDARFAGLPVELAGRISSVDLLIDATREAILNGPVKASAKEAAAA